MGDMWGLLGPEFLLNTRRTRTLGLGSSVRSFNDLAVPGLGGVWYGKQLLLATLGVAVAENARNRGAKVKNIEMANAIEALACWFAFNKNMWSRDARLRGSTKLHSYNKGDLSFRRVCQRSFYVTQPMRMATNQALLALGLVESDSIRFNAFRCLDEGMTFIEAAIESKRTVIDHLTEWVLMKDDSVDSKVIRKALSPLNQLPDAAIKLLRERLIQGGNEPPKEKRRRNDALTWVESLRKNKSDSLTWAQCPPEISEDHWHDLQAGALFFTAREAAISSLDAVESHIGNLGAGQVISLKKQVPAPLISTIEKIKSSAKQFLDFKSEDMNANIFCQECISDEPASILRALLLRDGHVLRLVGDDIKPGPAFRGSMTGNGDNEEQETPQVASIPLPENISYRVKNLYLLNLDMHGELEGWLNQESGESEFK